jgi:drug/metabolite transporter (DMT)-like permease
LLLAYLALASVCFFWGTTYAGIRMALESLPPFLLVGTRFTISGSLLLGGALLAGIKLPARRDLAYAALFGLVILGVGNTCLTVAQTWIPSSLAALLVTTSPFWLTGLEAAMPGGERLGRLTLAGMLIGLAGAALLVEPAWEAGLSADTVKGFLVLQLGCFSWSLGSVLQRRRIPHMNSLLNGAVQQLAAGLSFLLVAVLTHSRPAALSGRAVGAVLYLVVFGSIVGYTSYIYSLKHLPVALVAVHNYVNPVVAAVLGWLIYREPFGSREAAAMAVIFFGVFLVSRASAPRESSPEADAALALAAARPARPASLSPEPWRPGRRPARGEE